MYKAFHGFDKYNLIKLGNGGLVLDLSQFLLLPQFPQKNSSPFKSGQKELQNYQLSSLVKICDTLFAHPSQDNFNCAKNT